MKFLRKTAILLLSLLSCATFALAVSCGDKPDDSSSDSSTSQSSSSSSSSSSVDEEAMTYVYRVKIQTVGEFGLSGVVVDLYDGETLVASKTTTSSGYATFQTADVAATGEYDIRISEIPAGYDYADKTATYKTVNETGTVVTVPFTPTGVLSSTATASTRYALGDVMHDFTLKTVNDETFTLSEVLKEKQALLLNFWYTTCGPCMMEFPALNNAYSEYKESVEVLAISTMDDKSSVLGFQSSTGYTFPLVDVNNDANLTSLFAVAATPFTVIIDRYGVVAYMHVGSMTNKADFTSRFDLFIGDDYQPTVIKGSSIDADNGGNEGMLDYVKPNVDDPDISDVNTAMGNANTFTYSFDKNDDYAWPFVPNADKSAMTSPLKEYHYSYAILNATFTAQANTALCFDYLINSEPDCDILYVLMDGTIIHQLSGLNPQLNWETCYAYVFNASEAGEHKLTLLYMKDEYGSPDNETVCFKNLRFTSVEDMDADENVNVNIFRYAATVKNDAPDATTQFKNYITPVYNPEDEYYHVNEANGPILFANMMLASPWNETSVWILAVEGYCVVEGNDLKNPLEHHAWVASNNHVNPGYTPVTAHLKALLESVVSEVNAYKKWDGDTHANEWLELCVYYEHYGNTPEMPDPTMGLTYHAAYEMQLGKTLVSVPHLLTPRGFKYKFTPAETGIYHIYSTGTESTMCFFGDERLKDVLIGVEEAPFLGIYSYLDRSGDMQPDPEDPTKEIPNGNFDFHYRLEANKTYYFAFTTYLDMEAKYDVHIDKLDGNVYRYLDNAAVGPYSTNLESGQIYLPNAPDYEFADTSKNYTYEGETTPRAGDGYYHIKNNDGSLGSIIYADMVNVTDYLPYNSLESIAEAGESYAPEKRFLYIDGVDYTETVLDLVYMAKRNDGELKGLIAVDQEIMALLDKIVNKGETEATDIVFNGWLRLCYCYYTLSI